MLDLQSKVEEARNGIMFPAINPIPENNLDEIVGCLAYKGKPKTRPACEAGGDNSHFRARNRVSILGAR